MKTRFALALVAGLVLAQAGTALARPPRYYNPPRYGDGFFDGISAAFATIYSTLTSDEAARYNDDTLVQSAALFQDTGESTPLFQAFVATMSEKLVAQNGAQALDGLSAEEVNGLVARTILVKAAQR